MNAWELRGAAPIEQLEFQMDCRLHGIPPYGHSAVAIGHGPSRRRLTWLRQLVPLPPLPSSPYHGRRRDPQPLRQLDWYYARDRTALPIHGKRRLGIRRIDILCRARRGRPTRGPGSRFWDRSCYFECVKSNHLLHDGCALCRRLGVLIVS